MDSKQFKEFCRKSFEAQGFKKKKNYFYLLGRDILCGMVLTKSNFGPCYYVDVFYCIGDYREVSELPRYGDSDIGLRIIVMSKQQMKGKTFLTVQIEYEEYTEEDLRPYFDKDFEERILPPIYQGKKFILDKLGKGYTAWNKEDAIRKLQL